MMLHRFAAIVMLTSFPVFAMAQTTTTGSAGCATLVQAAVDGAAARIQADDTSELHHPEAPDCAGAWR